MLTKGVFIYRLSNLSAYLLSFLTNSLVIANFVIPLVCLVKKRKSLEYLRSVIFLYPEFMAVLNSRIIRFVKI